MQLWPSREQLRRMAWHPSAYAPKAAEVLTPTSVPVPEWTTDASERQLLAAVVANPDDDAPRVRYADWLESRDVRRAAFIRRQLSQPELIELNPDEEARFVPWGARDVRFRRGFAESMSLTGRSFVSLGATLLAVTPVREVRLVAVGFLMHDLAACPNLGRVPRLDLWANDIGPAGIEHLVGSPYVGSVQRLDLSRNRLGSAGVAVLLGAAWLPRLEELRIGQNDLTDADETSLRRVLGDRVRFDPPRRDSRGNLA